MPSITLRRMNIIAVEFVDTISREPQTGNVLECSLGAVTNRSLFLRQCLATHSQETQQWSVGARPPLVQWRLAGNGPDLNSTEKLGAVL